MDQGRLKLRSQLRLDRIKAQERLDELESKCAAEVETVKQRFEAEGEGLRERIRTINAVARYLGLAAEVGPHKGLRNAEAALVAKEGKKAANTRGWLQKAICESLKPAGVKLTVTELSQRLHAAPRAVSKALFRLKAKRAVTKHGRMPARWRAL